MNPHFEALEFPRILEQLKENALSEKAKQELGSLSPILSENVCRRKMAETTGAGGMRFAAPRSDEGP